MKRLKYLLLAFVSAVCLGGAHMLSTKEAEIAEAAASVSKPGIVEWDTTEKAIYANLNSLIVVEDGSGTTVYLDLPSGGTLTDYYQTGDGVLGAEDLSLADIYASVPGTYPTEAPEDGADLSDWVIVLGANNLDGTLQSREKMKLTMTGGSIRGIYNGCSSFQAESVSSLNAVIEVNVSGGSIGEIFTDFGYMNQYAGLAKGSRNITFNLTGGSIAKVTRGTGTDNNFGSTLNLGGSLVASIDMPTYVKGSMINVVSALSSTARLTFSVGESFARSNELFNISSDLLEGLDLAQITITNPPADSTNWVVYKNVGTVRYGYDVKVESIEISGVLKVGETLTLNYAPAEAAFKSVTWYTVDKTTSVPVTLSSGLTCTLTSNEGGEYVYVRATDKNDNTNIFAIQTSSPIQRVELPEVIIKNNTVSVYANGNDLLVRGSDNGSTIYIDLGTIGVYDAGVDKSLYEEGISGSYPNESNLTNVTIYAGCSTYKTEDDKRVYDNTGNVSITILSGEIKEIIVDSISSNKEKIFGYVELNLFGGKVERVAPNQKKVNGNVKVNLSGKIQTKLYAPNADLGGGEIEITGKLTGEAGQIVMLLDKPVLNGTPCIKGEGLESAVAEKFAFASVDGYALNSIKFLLLIDLDELVYDVVKVQEIKISGKMKVGSTLTVETNPVGAYITVTWYRSTSKHPYFATQIEGVSGASYTLTEEDEGMYIYVEVKDGYSDSVSFTAMTSGQVGPRVMKASTVWLVVVSSVVAALVLTFVIWFILWKKLIVGGAFMTPAFEKIDKWLFSKKKAKEQTQNTDAKSASKNNSKTRKK